MTYLANDLRTQADYVRGCLEYGHLGYADSKMLEKLELAAARITVQRKNLDDIQSMAKQQADENRQLTNAKNSMQAANTHLRQSLEQVAFELSATLANYQQDGLQDKCSSYKLFEILDLARKALK